MSDNFIHGGVPKSTPAPGAIERDWTQETLVNDITNAMGETYHFEILPGENPNNIPNVKRAQTHDDYIKNGEVLGCEVLITLPIVSK